MGWWGTGVIEGDTPYDYIGAFHDLCEIDYSAAIDSHGLYGALTKDVLEAHADVLWNHVSEQDDAFDTRRVAIQTLGYIWIGVGAALSDEKRALLLDAIQSDAWAGEGNTGRLDAMRSFGDAVMSYPNDGTPSEYNPCKGLFATMAEKFSGHEEH